MKKLLCLREKITHNNAQDQGNDDFKQGICDDGNEVDVTAVKRLGNAD